MESLRFSLSMSNPYGLPPEVNQEWDAFLNPPMELDGAPIDLDVPP